MEEGGVDLRNLSPDPFFFLSFSTRQWMGDERRYVGGALRAGVAATFIGEEARKKSPLILIRSSGWEEEEGEAEEEEKIITREFASCFTTVVATVKGGVDTRMTQHTLL